MTEESLRRQGYEYNDEEFSRRLSLFRQMDEDRHNEFINHVSIGISIAISVVVLLGLYVIASMLVDFGSGMYEFGAAGGYRSSDAKMLMVVALVVFIILVIFMSAYCLRFLVKLRNTLIHSVEESYFFRKEQMGKDQ